MKKIISLLLAFGMVLSLSSCGKSGNNLQKLDPNMENAGQTAEMQNTAEQELPEEQVSVPEPPSEPSSAVQPMTESSAISKPQAEDSVDKKDYVGSWICRLNDSQFNFMLLFSFFETGEAYYMAGWDEEDMAIDYSGTYTMENGEMTITLDDKTGIAGILETVMRPERDGSNLKLTYVSGNPITYLQGIGETLTFEPYEPDKPVQQ